MLNLVFAVFVLDVMVFADPVAVNRGLVQKLDYVSLITFVVVKIMDRKQGIQHD